MEKGTPIELKDIKPGYVVRAERVFLNSAMTITGKALTTYNDEFVVFDNGNGEMGLTAWDDSTYYLLSRPEKVIDKEDLKLGQLVRIEAGGYTYEGEVVGLHINQPTRKHLVELDRSPSGRAASSCFIEAITKVVLLS